MFIERKREWVWDNVKSEEEGKQKKKKRDGVIFSTPTQPATQFDVTANPPEIMQEYKSGQLVDHLYYARERQREREKEIKKRQKIKVGDRY
jgi:hypothetical protein